MKLREKMEKITKLVLLKSQTNDTLVWRFMNEDNGKMLDEKIEVCQRLIDGEKPEDIENYYDVLDDMPKNSDNEIVDW